MLPHNLPLQLTSFIGRAREIEEVKTLLTASRLVTLTGSGGCGKTRLAVFVASEIANEAVPKNYYADGVWLVEFASLFDPALVPQRIATALAVREQPDQPIVATLLSFLQDQELLLLLDNCEHLIGACAEIVDSLLRACAQLRILATSREALRIDGESVYRIPSLAVPVPASSVSLTDLLISDSVRLFVDRASAAHTGFKLTESNAPTVAQICAQLDGIPLALELAAARVKAITVEQIAQRLNDRFRLLSSGSRIALPRHQTLRAMIDWSYGLLIEPERILLRRLSVFAGGCTLHAAEQVGSGNAYFQNDRIAIPAEGQAGFGLLASVDVLELLTRLVEKSLVGFDERIEGESRYQMLETIRQYAWEKLHESGEADFIQTCHLDYFVAFAEAYAPKLHGTDQLRTTARFDADNDNLRAAVEWSRSEGRVERGLRLVAALTWFWQLRAYFREGRERAEELLQQPEAAPPSLRRARALSTAAWMTVGLNENTATRTYAEELIRIARALGPGARSLLAVALNHLADVIDEDDPERAGALRSESWALASQMGDPWIVAWMLQRKVFWLVNEGNYIAAHAAAEQSLRLFRAVGDHRSATKMLISVGEAYFREGDIVNARYHLQQCLTLGEAENNPEAVMAALNDLGEIARFEGNDREAAVYYEKSMAAARAVGIDGAIQMWNLGVMRLHAGEYTQARVLLSESVLLHHAKGRTVLVQMVLDALAGLWAAQGRAKRAVQIYGAVEHFREISGASATKYESPADIAEHEQGVAKARGQMEEKSFNEVWSAGRRLTLEQAIAVGVAEDTEEDILSVSSAPSILHASEANPVVAGDGINSLAISRRSAKTFETPLRNDSAYLLRVQAFAPIQVVREGHLLTSTEWTYVKPKELFFYLLFHAHGTKEQIGVELWPDASPSSLRSNFRVALHALRRALGRSDWISYENESYAFNRTLGFWCDVDEFEARLKEARQLLAKPAPVTVRVLTLLQQATNLYTGDFLDDLNENDWVLLRREGLRRQNLEALLTLGSLLFVQAQYVQAADIYRKVLSYDNYLEQAHRELMRCLAHTGDIAQALQHYQQFRAWLRQELNADPAPETTALAERLRRGQFS